MSLLYSLQAGLNGGNLFNNSFLFILYIMHTCLPGASVCLDNFTTFGEARMTANQKSYYNGLFRRFAFPPGTFLIFVPELTLPTWRDFPLSAKRSIPNQEDFQNCDSAFPRNGLNAEDDVAAVKNAAIQVSSPFYVYFDKLGWTHEDSLYSTPHRAASYIQEYLLGPTLQVFGVPPPSQATFKTQGYKRTKEEHKRVDVPLSEVHRVQLFHKIESLLEEIGAENGRACLLRAICELHEFPFDTGRFGIFGEILALIFRTRLYSFPQISVNQSPEIKDTRTKGSPESRYQCLDIYARAEKYGRTKECTRYTKYCQFSVFHWYWNTT